MAESRRRTQESSEGEALRNGGKQYSFPLDSIVPKHRGSRGTKLSKGETKTLSLDRSRTVIPQDAVLVVAAKPYHDFMTRTEVSRFQFLVRFLGSQASRRPLGREAWSNLNSIHSQQKSRSA